MINTRRPSNPSTLNIDINFAGNLATRRPSRKFDFCSASSNFISLMNTKTCISTRGFHPSYKYCFWCSFGDKKIRSYTEKKKIKYPLLLPKSRSYLGRVMRKRVLSHMRTTKVRISLRIRKRSLISIFVVRCLDSMICILAISKVSRF